MNSLNESAINCLIVLITNNTYSSKSAIKDMQSKFLRAVYQSTSSYASTVGKGEAQPITSYAKGMSCAPVATALAPRMWARLADNNKPSPTRTGSTLPTESRAGRCNSGLSWYQITVSEHEVPFGFTSAEATLEPTQLREQLRRPARVPRDNRAASFASLTVTARASIRPSVSFGCIACASVKHLERIALSESVLRDANKKQR